jgi:hypothetical protein
VAAGAAKARRDRQCVRANNPLLAWQDLYSDQLQDALNGYRDQRDAAQEMSFYGVYGALNGLLGNR